jgi:dihydroorotate dehydrogenase
MLWRLLLRPLFFRFDAERVHYVAMALFAAAMAVPGVPALVRALYAPRDPRLRTRLLGIDMDSPVGLAAGFDKNARWFNELAALGFGCIEVGTLTGLAQPGNDRPRLFRLPRDRAILNRFGFNNRGSADAAQALSRTSIHTVLGVNIGKSKAVPNEEAIADYVASLERLWPYARYIAVNVSSPNTQGLRDLQQKESLAALLAALRDRNTQLARERNEPRRPILVKVAPDLDSEGIASVVETVEELGIDGIIATNTTISREGLETPTERVAALGAGGISGAPLTTRSRAFVAQLYRRTGGRVPIVGVGGIMCGDDAWEMLRAGATCVQVYTGFIYGGPGFTAELNRTIARRLRERNIDSVAAIVGEATGA